MKRIARVGMAGLSLLLAACVSNPADVGSALNTVATAQQLRDGRGSGSGFNGGGVPAAADVPNDPRYLRANEALNQSAAINGGCKDVQARQQATLNSLAELEPLTSSPLFRQQQERLRVQNNSLAEIGKGKHCRMPTAPSASVATNGSAAPGTAPVVNYGKLSCANLKQEYLTIGAGQAAQAQGAIMAISQVALVAGGGAMGAGLGGGPGNAQQMVQMAGTLADVANGGGAAGNAAIAQQKHDIEAAASRKGCKLSPATVATLAGGTAPALAINYGKAPCALLKQEYGTVNAGLTAAQSGQAAQQAAGTLTALSQVGAQVGALVAPVAFIAAAPVALIAAAASSAGAANEPTNAAANNAALVQRKTDIEIAANRKRCRLDS